MVFAEGETGNVSVPPPHPDPLPPGEREEKRAFPPGERGKERPLLTGEREKDWAVRSVGPRLTRPETSLAREREEDGAML